MRNQFSLTCSARSPQVSLLNVLITISVVQAQITNCVHSPSFDFISDVWLALRSIIERKGSCSEAIGLHQLVGGSTCLEHPVVSWFFKSHCASTTYLSFWIKRCSLTLLEFNMNEPSWQIVRFSDQRNAAQSPSLTLSACKVAALVQNTSVSCIRRKEKRKPSCKEASKCKKVVGRQMRSLKRAPLT